MDPVTLTKIYFLNEICRDIWLSGRICDIMNCEVQSLYDISGLRGQPVVARFLKAFELGRKMITENWNSVLTQRQTIFDFLNESFNNLQMKHKDCFPDLRSGSAILLGSDYSGESSDAPYSIYSFLITTIEEWSKWESTRLKVRKDLFSDSRRMSFKNLGDSQRKKALIPFLTAANSIEGLSFSVAISKQCESLFSGEAPLDLNNPDFQSFKKWKMKVLEKAFITIHFLGFLLAGLAKENQDVFWFTDEDDIAANDQRICELTKLFGWIISNYLQFNLKHIRCGTTRCDNGTRQIEDLLAIPDLIAGALSEQLKLKNENGVDGVFFLYRGDFSEKTKTITWWFSYSKTPLKRLVCFIEQQNDKSKQNVSLFHFYNQ